MAVLDLRTLIMKEHVPTTPEMRSSLDMGSEILSSRYLIYTLYAQYAQLYNMHDVHEVDACASCTRRAHHVMRMRIVCTLCVHHVHDTCVERV